MTRFEYFVEKISLLMMEKSGFDVNNHLYSIEFDASNEDSQISMKRDDISLVLNFLEEHGVSLEKTDFRCADIILDVHLIKQGFNTKTNIHTSLGEESNIADLKNFVYQLESMAIPEETKLNGHLSVSVKIDNPLIDRISCGTCNYDDYLISPSDHNCFVRSEPIE